MFHAEGPRRSITILAVCGGSSDPPEPRRLSRVRTLRSLSTEESEPCTPFLINPRAPEVARAVGGARYYLCLTAPRRPRYAPDDRYGSWLCENASIPVVMPSGRQIFAFFRSPHDHRPQIPGAVIPRRVFTQPGSDSDFRRRPSHFCLSLNIGHKADIARGRSRDRRSRDRAVVALYPAAPSRRCRKTETEIRRRGALPPGPRFFEAAAAPRARGETGRVQVNAACRTNCGNAAEYGASRAGRDQAFAASADASGAPPQAAIKPSPSAAPPSAAPAAARPAPPANRPSSPARQDACRGEWTPGLQIAPRSDMERPDCFPEGKAMCPTCMFGSSYHRRIEQKPNALHGRAPAYMPTSAAGRPSL